MEKVKGYAMVIAVIVVCVAGLYLLSLVGLGLQDYGIYTYAP